VSNPLLQPFLHLKNADYSSMLFFLAEAGLLTQISYVYLLNK
jgi:hypothetical protein